jgi:hypothetical protein
MSAYKYHPDDEMTVLFRELTDKEDEQFFHPACRKVWRERGFYPMK